MQGLSAGTGLPVQCMTILQQDGLYYRVCAPPVAETAAVIVPLQGKLQSAQLLCAPGSCVWAFPVQAFARRHMAAAVGMLHNQNPTSHVMADNACKLFRAGFGNCQVPGTPGVMAVKRQALTCI